MTLQERLTDAENALHDWQTGRGVLEVVDQNGERIRYSAANVIRLQNYIADLRRQVNETSIAPMQFWGRP
ncbi:gpW [Hartmannibacter diazotrophicus]|uniref:GpW n=1 Tax=Hartmannibacter diazotrophicus TaxID=1482074 RepID=A0A2C9D1S4_9HYPH|nr:gpW family head-tail joining protein [Hartmannibacter diazotrophicus]SON54327.1 gpW [Hartmannibacter diazotrophicus]